MRFSWSVLRPLAEQRLHGRQVLAEVAVHFSRIGGGGVEPPELVRTIAHLERELRWLLDELDRLEAEQAVLDEGPEAPWRW